MEASTDFFITVVQCNRVLYDKSLSDFKNAVKKDEAWTRIARVTNMTVESAKRRYTSLRQKCFREKQKEELNRRCKPMGGAPWVYSEKLRFLDDFIKPRTTYTNDANFEDVRDLNNDADLEHDYETPLNGPDDNDLPPDDWNEEAGNSNSEIALLSDTQTISYHPDDVQRDVKFEIIDDIETATAFLSEYSGELTEYSPPELVISEVTSNQERSGNPSIEPDVSSDIMDSPSQREPLPEIVDLSTEPDVSSHIMDSSTQREPLSGESSRSSTCTFLGISRNEIAQCPERKIDGFGKRDTNFS